jgi:hypothetical protein
MNSKSTTLAQSTLIAGICVALDDALTVATEAKAQIASYVAEALGDAAKDSPAGRALAKEVTDLLVKDHKWDKSKASRFLNDELGLRCRAERSNKGTKKAPVKSPAKSGEDEITLDADAASLRDDLVALAVEESGGDEEAAARVLRAAFLSLVSA